MARGECRPSGALVYSGTGALSGEQFERLKGELEAGFQGPRNAGRPLLLEGGLEWRALSYSPRDMDFLEAKHAAAREIALALGVPPMLLAIPGDNTYANYQEANRALWRQTVLPLVARTAEQLAGWLAPVWGEELRLVADADNIEALAFEREALWARLERASFLSNDEKRAAAGYGEGMDAPSDSASRSRPEGALADARRNPTRDPAGSPQGSRIAQTGNARKFNPYHDELGRFTTAEGAASGGADTAEFQLAQDSARRYSVDLIEEELRGGHTIARHVGKSDDDLISRVAGRQINLGVFVMYRWRAGSFASRESANDFVNRTLEANPEIVDRVANGASSRAFLTHRFGYPTGKEAFRESSRTSTFIRPTFEVGVEVRHNPQSSRGYRVHTAFPRNADPRE